MPDRFPDEAPSAFRSKTVFRMRAFASWISTGLNAENPPANGTIPPPNVIKARSILAEPKCPMYKPPQLPGDGELSEGAVSSLFVSNVPPAP